MRRPLVFLLLLASTSPAAAAALAGCPSPFRPPPCIVVDGSRIAQMVQEVTTRTRELQELRASLTGFQAVRQSLQRNPGGPLIRAQSIDPLPRTSLEAAANAAISVMLPATPRSSAEEAPIRAFLSDAQRSLALNAVGVAIVAKTRLEEIRQQAEALARAAATSPDQPTDWRYNTQAQALLAAALTIQKDVEAERLLLRSAPTLATYRAPSAPRRIRVALRPLPPPNPAHDIAPLAGAVGRLNRLRADLQSLDALETSTRLLQETLAEFQLIEDLRTRADATLRLETMRLAQLHNARTRNRMSPDAVARMGEDLYRQAVLTLERIDVAGWADPARPAQREAALTTALRLLDSRVQGSLPPETRDALARRQDSAKQAQYFTPIRQDAETWLGDHQRIERAIATLWGLDGQSGSQLTAGMRAREQELLSTIRRLATALDDAPELIRAKRATLIAGL